MSVVWVLVLSGLALAQQIQVSGRVTSLQGDPLAGVSVRVQGTDIHTGTDANGIYSLTAPSDAVLIMTSLGYRPVALNIAGRTVLDVTMEPAIAVLDAVVVTGYSEQRRADITGAITAVDMPSVNRQTTASVLQRLDGRIPGVTVNASGNPGGRSTVRIRGVSSFQNNEPLYIIDGTPVESDYLNFLNPNDIESIQVLKDASAASIYGSRATNGVVIIQTIRGSQGAPRFTMDVRVGMATPVRGYDDFLITDALEYHEVLKRSYENAGLPVPENVFGDPDNPSVPAFIWPNDGVSQTTCVCENTYEWGNPDNPNGMIMRGSPGTNWWDVVFGTGMVADANLAVSGGGAEHRYTASFNYLSQEGTAAYNRFQRGTARINTEFGVGALRVGENISLSFQEQYGGRGDGASEGGIMGVSILIHPVVPVYTIEGERRLAVGEDPAPHFAGAKAANTGGSSFNPLKVAWANKDNKWRSLVAFGSVFASIDVTEQLRLRTTLGFKLDDGSVVSYSPIYPENPAPSYSDRLGERFSTTRGWTWSNVLTYSATLGERHNVEVLLGQEASKNRNRDLFASMNDLITNTQDAWYISDALGNPDTKNVTSWGSVGSLLSYFGKVDYNFADRYHLNFTLRYDGSSTFGPENRWGTFPAFSAGWRLSQEPFMQANQFFTNIMLRFGWGVTGNQNIPQGRVVSQFGGYTGNTYYDISGSNNSIVPGFRQTVLGNPNLKWEENTSMNVGLDVEFLSGAANLVVDLYQRETDNLLFAPPIPGTAGQASPPIVNVGQMKNTGIDFSLGLTGELGGADWRITLNGSHYKNEILRIDGEQDFFFGEAEYTRFGFKSINQIGGPIGAFYGLICDGIFLNQAEVDAHADQDGKAVGRLKFRDINNDGVVNTDDRTVTGDPHPDFTAGLDLEANWGAFDFSATVFGTFGNDILDVNKQFYVFQHLSTNVRRDLLTDAAVVENAVVTNPDAKYPRLDFTDTFSGHQPSSFYVEDGSYVRLRSLQIGYRLPQSWITGMRVYLQVENLFTITGYSGLDPALPAPDATEASGDVRDQYRGWDRSSYPSNRMLSLGINATF